MNSLSTHSGFSDVSLTAAIADTFIIADRKLWTTGRISGVRQNLKKVGIWGVILSVEPRKKLQTWTSLSVV
jgi:hypothetical protein